MSEYINIYDGVVSANSDGWVRVCSPIFDPVEGTVDLEVILETSDPGYQAQLRLMNDATQIASLTTYSNTPVLRTTPISPVPSVATVLSMELRMESGAPTEVVASLSFARLKTESPALDYPMRAWSTTLLAYVYWTSTGSPDFAGAYSGQPPEELANITLMVPEGEAEGNTVAEDRVRVSSTDSSPDFLEQKLAGSGITLTKSGVGDETLTLTVTPGSEGQVLKTVGGVAAWGAGGGGAGVTPVANITAMAALGPDVALAWVETLACLWYQNPDSALTPDGITVVAADDAGNWERIISSTSPKWLYQAEWWLDSATGEDENDGNTSGTPLLTFEELNRRLSVGPIHQFTEVWVAEGSTYSSVTLKVNLGEVDQAQLSLRGVPTVDLSGTLSSIVTRSHVTPEGTLIEATGVTDWTSHVGKRIQLTSGTDDGAIAWIATQDPDGSGNDVARTSVFAVGDAWLYTITEAESITGSETFDLQSLPHIEKLTVITEQNSIDAATVDTFPARVVIQDLDLAYCVLVENQGIYECYSMDGVSFSPGGLLLSTAGNAGQTLNMYRCKYQGIEVIAPLYSEFDLFLGSYANFRTLNSNIRASMAQGSGLVPYKGHLGVEDFQTFDGTEAFFVVAGSIDVAGTISGKGLEYGLRIGGGEPTGDVIFLWNADPPNIQASVAEVHVVTSDSEMTWTDTNYRNDEQKGSATLVGGTVTVTARHSNERGVVISRDTPGGTTGDLSAPSASRTESQFVINSSSVLDTSTVDWWIPPTAGYGNVIVGYVTPNAPPK